MGDPRIGDGWMRSHAGAGKPQRLQVRLDAPDGITYAPDQLHTHNATKRLFVTPPRPEPRAMHYDFESEIRGYDLATRTEPTYIIGEDDVTPAQQLAAAYRDREGRPVNESRHAQHTAEAANGRPEPVGLSEKHDTPATSAAPADASPAQDTAPDAGAAPKDASNTPDADPFAGMSKSARKKARAKAAKAKAQQKEADEANEAPEANAAPPKKGTDQDKIPTSAAHDESMRETAASKNEASAASKEMPKDKPASVTTPSSIPADPAMASAPPRAEADAPRPKAAEHKPAAAREPSMDTLSLKSHASQTPSTLSTYAPTLSGISLISEISTKKHRDGLPFVVRQHLQTTTFQPPASLSSAQPDARSSFRSSETLADQPYGRDAGSQWERINGPDIARYAGGPDTARAADELTGALFVPDPRPWRPYRLVRRTDPRQVLVLCAGTTVSPAQIQAKHGTSAAPEGRSVASYFTTTENTALQGGIGMVYTPTPALCRAMGAPYEQERAERNLARRLELPTYPNRTTTQRAALRSVIAALEYVRWEEEGFDKVVVATHNAWIPRGIAHDIWTWRTNGWRLTRETPQGAPGDNVPDRDLWELLDALVREYEDIEYVASLTQLQLPLLAYPEIREPGRGVARGNRRGTSSP